MNRVTFSGLSRALACHASAYLPQVSHISSDATAGTARHEVIAAVLSGTPIATALADVEDPSLRRDCEALNLEGILDELAPSDYPVEAESAYWYHPGTGEAGHLGMGLDRDYSGCPEGAIAGTTDVTQVLVDRGRVIDWKTGHGDVEEPGRNWQLLIAALAVSVVHAKDRVEILIGRTWGDSGILSWEREELDRMDLDGIAMELGRRWEKLGSYDGPEEAPITAGEHCRYCPALRNCPAQRGSLAAIVELTNTDPSALEDATVVDAWQKLKGIEKALEMAKDLIRNYVAQTPITLDDGRVLGLHEQNRDRINDHAALLELVREVHGARDHAELLSESIKITKSSLKGVLGAKAAGELIETACATKIKKGSPKTIVNRYTVPVLTAKKIKGVK